MVTIITLEIGDRAVPVVDTEYVDPATGILVTLPTNGAEGIVLSRVQVSVDLETDLPIYNYQVAFDPIVSYTYIVPADPEDPESVETERTVSVDILGMDNEDLGLVSGQEPVVDVVAIQQTINEAKQVSKTSLNSATSINNELKQLEVTDQSYGKSEIDSSVQTMEKNDADIATRDVIGLSDDQLLETGQENKITAELLSSDQQIILEYVDNLFAYRQVLADIDTSLKDASEQSAEQLLRGQVEDQANEDAFSETFLQVEGADNAFVDPSAFSYPVEEEQEINYPEFSRIATLMQSSLLNPETSGPDVVISPPEDPTVEIEDTPFEPIIPPGTEE
ncbi:MAG: hypothetical protein DRQ40_10565 [Gammaproteobacteria bacterium]|nr:MAG: hypothetical protein DRQ40_10565 [Gammaproteobacteria bacterium]